MNTLVLNEHEKLSPYLTDEDRHKALQNQFDIEFTWSQEIETILRNKFKFIDFIGKQKEAINATLCGKDVLINTSTSSGKSLIYLLAGMIDGGVTVVLIPTISLMESQIVNLQNLGVQDIAHLNSSATAEERKRTFRKLHSQSVRFFFMTPEMITQNKDVEVELTRLHSEQQLKRIVIDEAHLVNEYKHRDFRVAYTEVGEFISRFKQVPILALTATATAITVIKVQKSLKFAHGYVYLSSDDFDRTNLHYEVIHHNQV